MIRRPPRSTLFPYTRSSDLLGLQARNDAGVVAVHAVDLDAGGLGEAVVQLLVRGVVDRKSTRLNSSHSQISYAVFCLKKKKTCPRLVCMLRRMLLDYSSRLP